ncbi:hypothetical protein caldi_32650 [Caldinitratiruptor microaerophilus]|uniref:Anti-sigma-W factor RsiW n=2 Tax=Caldinitratiruptor microaerophilus TaxID=671077 RepID=A0AA35CMR7_9FIRM|nr:hypothetical protein caldi_32650 [Caldinitratiruptor microaerophilus]
MTCQHVQELLDSYLDGGLPSREASLVSQHLSSCSTCRADLELWREIRAALNPLDVEVPPTFHAQLMARVRALEPVPARRAQTRVPLRLGLAAAMAAAVAALVMMDGQALRPWVSRPNARQSLASVAPAISDQTGSLTGTVVPPNEDTRIKVQKREASSDTPPAGQSPEGNPTGLIEDLVGVAGQRTGSEVATATGKPAANDSPAPAQLPGQQESKADVGSRRTFVALGAGIPAHHSNAVKYSVNVVVQVADPVAAVTQLERVISELNGVISLGGQQPGGQWEYEIWVPVRLANVTTAAVSSLGELKSRQVSMKDFSGTIAEIDKRIAYLNGQIGWVPEVANDVQVRAAIAALRKRRQEILDSTSMAVVRVSMISGPVHPVTGEAQVT